MLPNATGIVDVHIMAGQNEGPYKHIVDIAFDNGLTSRLSVTGKTHSHFHVKPGSIQIDNAILSVPQTATCDITIEEGIEAEISDARLENSDIELIRFATMDISNGVRCCLTLVPRVPKRRIISSLILHTSCKRQPEIRIPLIVYPKMLFDIRPPTAFFGVVKPGAKVSKKFVLKSRDFLPIQIKSIKDGDRKTPFIMEKANGSLALNVEILCAGEPGFATGELVIELEDPAVPKVSIPYSYVVRK